MASKVNFKKILKYVCTAYVVFSIVIVLYLIDNLICNDIMKVSNRLILNDNWNVWINDDYYEDISIDSFTFEAVNKNDIVVMETIVPDDYRYREATLCMDINHVTVAMYVDGKLEYEYGYDRYKEEKVTGSGNLLINFHEQYKGKELRLEFVATEDEAFSKIGEMWLSEWENSFRYIITTNRLPLLMGSFLLVLGVMAIIVQVFASAISVKYSDIFMLAIFSICIGIWTLCYYDIMLIFAIPLYKISLMEHMSLFISPIPIVGYMYSYVKETYSKWILYVYRILLVAQVGLTSLAIFFHIVNWVHGPQMLKYFQAIFMIDLLFFGYVIYKRKNKEEISKVTTIGLSVVAICVFYELATYLATRYTGYKFIELKGVSSVGVTIFIGILAVDLYKRATKSIMEQHEKAILVRRAYTDELTQLNNRAYCSEHMRKLSVDENSKYTIINFDLNGLKKMNDTYGHIKGDELICYAALVLEKTFAKEGVVGRMGGDEFIAIIENDSTEFIDQLLVKFNENIQEANEKKSDLYLSISYGYATNTELEGGSSEKVYQLADERMYAHKQEMKKDLTNK